MTQFSFLNYIYIVISKYVELLIIFYFFPNCVINHNYIQIYKVIN